MQEKKNISLHRGLKKTMELQGSDSKNNVAEQLRFYIEPINSHIKQQSVFFSKLLQQFEILNNNFSQFKTDAVNHFSKITKIEKNIEKNEKLIVSELTELKGMNADFHKTMIQKVNLDQNMAKIYDKLNQSYQCLINIKQFQSPSRQQNDNIPQYQRQNNNQEYKNELQIQKKNLQLITLKNQERISANQNCQYKDRQILIPFTNFLRKQYEYQDAIQQKQFLQKNIPKWVGNLYYKLSQQTFVGYQQNKLNDIQMKSFFSHNLILNSIQLMQHLKQNFSDSWEVYHQQYITLFEDLSKQSLRYLLSKFPQKRNIFVRPDLEKLIQTCEISQDPQFNILKNLKFSFRFNSTGRYDKHIKQMLNKLIQETNLNLKNFRQQMKKIFLIPKISTDSEKITMIQNEAQQFEEIQNKIGMKFSQNFQGFTLKQIEQKGIKIKSPEVLRILIKWIQELQGKIFNSDKYIKNRYFPFLSRQGQEIKLTRNQRNNIADSFSSYFKKYKQKNYLIQLQNIQSKLISFINYNKEEFKFINQNNVKVGLTTCVLSHTVSDIAIKYISDLIHSIFIFQQSCKQKKLDNAFQKFYNIDYITFSIFDLLRAKCIGTKDQIMIVYENLKKNQNLKIIRVKNRLNTGNRDFLLNLQLKNCAVICQLQLGLSNQKKDQNQNKFDYLDHFNHFLYQLNRSKYGSLTEASILNFYFTGTISFFSQKLDIIKRKQKNKRLYYEEVELKDHDEIILKNRITKKFENTFLYICDNCYQIKYPYESFLKLFSMESTFYCGECILNGLPQEKQNLYLLNSQIEKYLQKIEFTDLKELDQLKDEYYIIIQKKFTKTIKIFRKIQNHFIQSFSNLKSRNQSEKFKFYTKEQLNINYIFKFKEKYDLSHTIRMNTLDVINSRIRYYIFNPDIPIQELIQTDQIRLIFDQQIQLHLILDCNENGYKKLIAINKGYKYINMLINSKIQHWDLEQMYLTSQMLESHLHFGRNLIKRINLTHNNIKNLKFLEGTQLLQLNLNRNDLEEVDFTNIQLEKIENLNLSQNKLSQIKIHNKLLRLVTFKAHHNQLTSIDIKQSIGRNIKQIDLEENHLNDIKSIEKLQGINQLEILNLTNNKINTINLQRFANIKELYIANNKLIQIEIPTKFIEKINLSSNQIKKLKIFSAENLRYINFRNNLVEKIEIDKGQKIEIFDAAYNQLREIQLKDFISLKQLILNNNCLKLVNLPIRCPIEKMNLSHNQLSNIIIAELNLLDDVDISDNKLEKLIFNKNSEIIRLNLAKNCLKTLNIVQLTKIEEIHLNNNQLQQVTFAANNPSLYYLNLNYNHLNKFKFEYFTNLQRLTITHNKLSQLKFKSQLSLVHLNLSHNLIQKIQLLDIKFQNLKELNLAYNNITEIYIKETNTNQLLLLYLRIISNQYRKQSDPRIQGPKKPISKFEILLSGEWFQRIMKPEITESVKKRMKEFKVDFIDAVQHLQIFNQHFPILQNISNEIATNQNIIINSSIIWFKDQLKKEFQNIIMRP